MTRLIVRLLGSYRVELDGRPVYAFETDKARALLAYLMVEADRPHRRETLASLLWPERPESAARANLRQALACIRRALNEPASPADCGTRFLLATPTDVQFNLAADYMLDVAELEAFGRSDPTTRTHRVGAGARLLPAALCADFLSGFSVPDSEAFEAWVLNRQEYCHRLALEILDGQIARFEADGDHEGAVAAARLELSMEPWLEEAHRACMRGLARAGRRDEALHQFDVCCRALQVELGVEPTATTRELYAAIRSGRPEFGDMRPEAEALRRTGSVAAQPLPASRTSPGPATGSRGVAAGAHPPGVGPPTSDQLEAGVVAATPDDAARAIYPPGGWYSLASFGLVARQDELGQLAGYLEAALAGEGGVVFVSGDAGSGKSALLETFAAASMRRYPDLLVAGAHCNPGGDLDAFAPLRRLGEVLFGDLATYVDWRRGDSEQGDRLRGATGVTLAALREHGADLVGTLVGAPSLARRAAGLRLPIEAARAQTGQGPHDGWPVPVAGDAQLRPALPRDVLFDELLCTLAGIARAQPLLVLLDDLHWVDDATAAFLVHLGRELAGSPGCLGPPHAPVQAAGRPAACRVLVIGAYRSASVRLGRRDPHSGDPVRHPLAAAVNELRRAKGELVVELDRADGRAFVEAYVDMEANRLGAPFRDALYAQTAGHALFTVEMLRNLKARGELFRDEVGRWVAREQIDWARCPSRLKPRSQNASTACMGSNDRYSLPQACKEMTSAQRSRPS